MANSLIVFLAFLSITIRAQEPQLGGGLTAFLEKNTVYPRYSLQHCIQGTVDIGFKLNKKGEIYRTQITRGIGTDLDDEALRLIKLSSGKWNVPLNYDTLALVIVPINFSLKGYECEKKDKRAVALAINAYKLEAEIINVIVNFYRNKEKGVFNEREEPKILKLRSDLGIDDEYLSRLLGKSTN